MTPYRTACPPPPFASVEPDPFPEEERVKELKRQQEERRMRRVALAAERLVSVTKTADKARIYFVESPKLLREVDLAVTRAFRAVHDAVEEWTKSR